MIGDDSSAIYIHTMSSMIDRSAAFRFVDGDGCAARSAPCVPEIHHYDFAFIWGDNGVEEFIVGDVRRGCDKTHVGFRHELLYFFPAGLDGFGVERCA